MAGNVATIFNPDNYKQIYNEGHVLFDKDTYSDMGDDIGDLFSGRTIGSKRESRKREKEARDKIERDEGDKQIANYYSKRPFTQYVDKLYHALNNMYGKRILDTFWGPQGIKHPMGDSLIEWKNKASDLQSKEEIDASKEDYEQKLKQALGVESRARGGTIPQGMHRMPDGRLMLDSSHKAYADGGLIEQAEQLYDFSQNYPDEFERVYNGLKGEATKIYDWWKDVLGLRRGGRVNGRGGRIGFRK